jgi:hypothetical protein
VTAGSRGFRTGVRGTHFVITAAFWFVVATGLQVALRVPLRFAWRYSFVLLAIVIGINLVLTHWGRRTERRRF